MKASIGRYGPYVNLGPTYVSLRGDDDVLTIGLNRARALIADARQRKPPGRTLGEHPADGKPVALKSGRYGPYVEHGKLRATLPKGTDADSVELAKAVELLDAKAERSGKAPAGKASGKRSGGAAKDKAAKGGAAKGEAANGGGETPVPDRSVT